MNYPLGTIVGNGWGSGFALSDMDNDGDVDIVVVGAASGQIGVYENDGTGNFTNRSLTTGMGLMFKPSGVSTVDYDNDGDLDIFIGSYSSAADNHPSRLYRNDGGFTFTDVTAASGLESVCRGMAAAWGDYNQDGNIDLYYSVRTLTGGDLQTNFLFHNNGDGTFTDVAVALNVDSEDYPTLVPSFFDYDHDGDDDIYLGTDRGSSAGTSWTNRMYRNDGGVFTEVSVATNTLLSMDCMGIAVGDVNFDGFFDMYLTNSPGDGNFLMVSDGAGAFVDQTAASGTIGAGFAWGTVMADFDNDSYLDIYVNSMMSANRLFRGAPLASWPMVDEAQAAGVDIADWSFCVAVADIDGDNDLDMLVCENNSTLKLYINNSPDAALNNWVRFRTVGKDTNLYALGTMVSVTTGGKTQLRESRAGVNYKVADEQVMHFGLGLETQADSMLVEFNDGTDRNYTNAPSGDLWTLYPMSLMGDANGNGRVDLNDVVLALLARTKSGQSIKPGQERMDIDGDFVIDMSDVVALWRMANQQPRKTVSNSGSSAISPKGAAVGP
ncbi:MAG: VCBS repeat-containing protein [Phycisphaerales bacterium]|nr:VCBS repeat-containing protein [Phycisphaerales bacterium]